MTSICSLLGVFTSCRLACAQVSSPDRFVCFWSNVNWKYVFGRFFFFLIVSWMQTNVQQNLLFRLLEIWFACCFVHLNEKHNISILNFSKRRHRSYFLIHFFHSYLWFSISMIRQSTYLSDEFRPWSRFAAKRNEHFDLAAERADSYCTCVAATECLFQNTHCFAGHLETCLQLS